MLKVCQSSNLEGVRVVNKAEVERGLFQKHLNGGKRVASSMNAPSVLIFSVYSFALSGCFYPLYRRMVNIVCTISLKLPITHSHQRLLCNESTLEYVMRIALIGIVLGIFLIIIILSAFCRRRFCLNIRLVNELC